MDGRRLYWPRGRVLGGSSSLNAMVYIRGHALDYDRWVEEGAAGWSYAEVLPYFRRAETFSGGGDAYRGGDGPLHVTRGTAANPLFDAWIAAGDEAGYPPTADMNGYRQEGMGRMDMTIHARPPLEHRAAPICARCRRRPNLTVLTGCLATRILLERGRAVGRRVCRGRHRQAGAGRARGDPGRRRHQLAAAADAVRASARPTSWRRPVVRAVPRPARGRQNLQDHLEFYFQVECLRAGHAAGRACGRTTWSGSACAGSCSTTARRRARIWRPAASSAPAPGVRHPDIQFHFLPALVEDHGRSKGRMHAFQGHVGPMRPASRGWLRLRSADPRQHPLIEPNYLAEARDRAEMRACVRLTREIFAQPAFDRYRGRELQPGAGVADDASIDAFIRAQGRQRLPPLLHLPDGRGRAGRGRPAVPCARADGPARGRRLDHAQHRLGQPQCADDHDGGEGGRPDPGPAAAAGGACAGLGDARLRTRRVDPRRRDDPQQRQAAMA